jgi:two-component system, cell cycle response regulator
MKVLVIDDNPVDRKLLCAVLEDDGDQTSSRASAEDALESVRSDQPDIILLDLSLPGIDGLSFVRTLRAYPDTREVPVVAMTAYPLRYRSREVLAAGCSAYIVKPVSTRELAAQLRSIAAIGAAPPPPPTPAKL